MTTRKNEKSSRAKACLSFSASATFECSLFGLLITAELGEHVHVCSIYSLIRLQGSALKHALWAPSHPPTHPRPGPSDKEAILALISFHYVRGPYLVSVFFVFFLRDRQGSLMAPTQITRRNCPRIHKKLCSLALPLSLS